MINEIIRSNQSFQSVKLQKCHVPHQRNVINNSLNYPVLRNAYILPQTRVSIMLKMKFQRCERTAAPACVHVYNTQGDEQQCHIHFNGFLTIRIAIRKPVYRVMSKRNNVRDVIFILLRVSRD